MESKEVSALILAAGLSERMERNKFALTFPDGKTFLEHIIREYHNFGCGRIAVVLNPQGKKLCDSLLLKLPCVPEIYINHHPEKGRNYSLRTGLLHLMHEKAVFIHNVDNPFVNHVVLRALMNSLAGVDYSKPVFKGKGGHPLLICRIVIYNYLNSDPASTLLNIHLKDFAGKLIEVAEPGVLVNINTEDEYQKFLKGFHNQHNAL